MSLNSQAAPARAREALTALRPGPRLPHISGARRAKGSSTATGSALLWLLLLLVGAEERCVECAAVERGYVRKASCCVLKKVRPRLLRHILLW